MTIHYPKGATPSRYHSKIAQGSSNIQYGKRGMRFEEMINESNRYYLDTQQAVIHKKPTPIQIVNVDYPKRSAAKITEAYFRQASTTDYNGVYNGKYIDFEAKETKNKTRFPLSNFHDHQITHMQQCVEQGGVCFVLLWFSSLQRCFYLNFSVLLEFWQQQDDKRKSIPISDIEQYGIECPLGLAPQIDYLKALTIDQF